MAAPAPRPPGAPFEKKGEVHELRQLLRTAAADRDQQKKRDAIKKVIAYMTLGIDVSPLFSEMIMASATKDLVQKKMVYLYLMNYAESNADLAILAVNTLQQDSKDDDPMIRGLALRSLCSLSLLQLVEYLTPAVQKGLEDVNGYVRKTAVIGAVKLFKLASDRVLDSDILPALKRLVGDSDPHVVANTIHALHEILAEEGGFTPTRETMTPLLNKITQFSEWGQCAVLQLLSRYQVKDEGEMFDIMNILDALLKQSSSAVVLSVTKIFMDLTSNRPDLQCEVLKRLRAPLLTLSSTAQPELAYTVLVHIQSLCDLSQQIVEIFASEFKQFFCRYNDPSYIKSVKIEVLILVADDGSSESIVGELSEYVTDVDAEISRRAVRAIGKIGVRVASTAEMIVGTLNNLLSLDIDYVSTESAVVMKDLVRKYPEQFQRASGAIERCMKIVTEPEGKCALLWILGACGHLIEDAPYLLEPMIDGFLEEASGAVRLEMLTAAVKLFFSRAPEMQKMLGRLLQKAICETTHPDVRDRALLYYRLLERSPDEARHVIVAPMEVIGEFHDEHKTDAAERIYEDFNTLSIIYKQPAAKFVNSKTAVAMSAVKMQPPAPPAGSDVGMDLTDSIPESSPVYSEPVVVAPAPAAPESQPNLLDTGDMLDLGDPTPSVAPHAAAPAASTGGDLLDMDDLLGGFGGPVSPAAAAAATFALQPGFVMNEQVFQSQWGAVVNQLHQVKAMKQSPLSIPIIQEALRNVGINVIASGVMPGGVLKLFVYAKQAAGPAPAGPGEVFFMAEVLLSPNAQAQATVKGANASPASLTAFYNVFWGALQDFVM